jgi:hypothetical protein
MANGQIENLKAESSSIITKTEQNNKNKLLNTLENALIHNGMKLGKQVAECN